MTDFELLEAWRTGSAVAAETLAERHYASVRRFFDLRAPLHADDLTQETFLAAVQAVEGFRRESSFKTFLFAIAHKQFLRHLRREGRADGLTRFGDEKTTATSLSIVAARNQEHQLLLMALTQLPFELQIITELYYWEDMRTAAIGEVLGLNPSTVTTRLARARELLRNGVEAMTQPGPLRDRMLGDLEGLSRALGVITATANTMRGRTG